MSHPIDLTITLKLKLPSPIEPSGFYNALPELLQTGLGDILIDSADAVRVVACSDPAQKFSQSADLSSLFSSSEAIGIVWSVDDVLEIRPYLSREQAVEVLNECQSNHDATTGINWDILAWTADDLFGSSNATDMLEEDR